MLFRGVVVLALIVLFSFPASGVSLFPLPDQALQQAADYFRDKDYRRAQEAALKSPKSGIRDFTLGMAAVRLQQWPEATTYLEYSAVDFPLLGDYALYNQALAFSKLGKHAEALASLGKMLKIYPDGPLKRGASFLQGNELYDSGAYKDAIQVYTDFIEKYPAGADSLLALYKSALCREQIGDPNAAAVILRSIPINYPASSLAPKASAELERLGQSGIKVAPLSTAEILHQGNTLCDLGKHEQAVKTFELGIQQSTDPEMTARLQFKKGQALFKSRQYKDAELLFSTLSKTNQKKEIAVDIQFWLARTLARNGKDDQAVSAYLQTAETWPKSAFADDALLAAAQIRKSQNKSAEALELLQRSLFLYPESSQKKNVLWEMAWERYQARDFKAAVDLFEKATKFEELRDKALYWRGKSQLAAGDTEGAKETFGRLVMDYPLGYYALTYKQEAGISAGETTVLPRNLADSLPVPAGFDRIKALIALGFHEEASKELSGQKNPKTSHAVARLYLEMGNYNAALKLFSNQNPRRLDKDSALFWGINYPLAFSDHVTKNAGDNNLPASLVYAIIRAESTYSPTALSPVGAVGLMQLMPATAAAVARGKVDRSSLTKPELNIRYGAKHLKDLLVYHNNNLVLVIAAYNAGSGNVGKWEKRLGNMPREEFIENIPFAETKEYVKKVLTGMELYQRFYAMDQKPLDKPQETAAVTPL